MLNLTTYIIIVYFSAVGFGFIEFKFRNSKEEV